MTRTTTDRTSARGRTAAARRAAGFTAEGQAAMNARVRELKAEARAQRSSADGKAELLTRVDEMPAAERHMARRIDALVMATAPGLQPRTWYGMPAWSRDGKVLCFFQAAGKFKTRYATLGFSEQAKLDDGAMWPTSFALVEFTPAVEKRLRALLAQALG